MSGMVHVAIGMARQTGRHSPVCRTEGLSLLLLHLMPVLALLVTWKSPFCILTAQRKAGQLYWCSAGLSLCSFIPASLLRKHLEAGSCVSGCKATAVSQ